MTRLDPEMLLEALAAEGQAVAVIEGNTVVAANQIARQLGDLVSLAKTTAAAPQLVRPDREHAFEVRTVPSGGVTLLLGRDVRDREQAREQLARSDEILSLASHELKGPLHVLGMICHLLETRASRGDGFDRSTIDRLRRQVQRLNRLINQLLDTSRAQEGRLHLDLDEADLAEAVREEVAQVDASRAADLHLELPGRAPLRADRGRMGGIVHQLIDNALRFTAPGTPIRVQLREDPGAWLLTVADEGPGVLAVDQPTLFERYKSPERQRGRRPYGRQGLGLGLYVASVVTRLHGGTLSYEPGVPTGATFKLRLPA